MSATTFRFRLPAALLSIFTLVTATGCQTGTTLMETPNIYADKSEVFTDVREPLRSTDVRVLYATDRAAARDKDGNEITPIEYTYQRSHALVAGFATVSLDEDATWDELVLASTSETRPKPLKPVLKSTEQLVSWPRSNNRFVPVNEESLDIMVNPEVAAAEAKSSEAVCGCVNGYGGTAEPQPVFVFVHGYNTDFEYATVTMAQIWHFLGRTGVPAVYSWPAGRGGARGYMFDRESGEFTIFHLKQFIRTLAACPSVSEINIIAHSRGTDVAISALRELNLEARASDADTRSSLKLNNVVLAAPDLDMQVVAQRVGAEGLLGLPKHFVIYISPDDRAILLATYLFNSVKRIGMLRANDLEPQQTELLENMPRLEVIESDINRVDFIGHGYFYKDPAVSSDLILLLKDNKKPGTANGRPLEENNGMYVLHYGYPEYDQEEKK